MVAAKNGFGGTSPGQRGGFLYTPERERDRQTERQREIERERESVCEKKIERERGRR